MPSKFLHSFVWLALLATAGLCAQTRVSRPTFGDYPAGKIYQGPAAAPNLDKEQQDYRTQIVADAKSQVQFAAHYTVPVFDCGSDCSMFYIVDAITGRVYDGLAVVEFPDTWEAQFSNAPQRVEFHPESRLLKISGCPNEKNCGYYDYVMIDGKGLKLIDKQLLPRQFQP